MSEWADAAVLGRIEAQVPEVLADWEIDLSKYTIAVSQHVEVRGPYYRGGPTSQSPWPTFEAVLTHRATGAEIKISEIYVDDSGEITQCGTNYGALTL